VGRVQQARYEIVVDRFVGEPAEIRRRYGTEDTEVIVGDLIAPGGPQRILDDVHARGLTVGLVGNNARRRWGGPILGRSLDAQLRGVELNVNALVVLNHAIGGELVARGSGGIINVSSVAAFQPMPFPAADEQGVRVVRLRSNCDVGVRSGIS
jgi:short-subunit dehydrogenase